MGSTAHVLDKSQWTPAAHRRDAKHQRWKDQARKRAEWEASPDGRAYAAAVEAHPLRNVIADQVTDESLAASQAAAGWMFKAWDAGNGHREAFAMRKRVHPQADLDRAIRRDLRHMVPRGLGDREKSVANAAQRAKQEVRRLCKVMKVDALWTLTYKANQQVRDLTLAHLKEFRRRTVAVLGDYPYVAVLQEQERGAWHIHLASRALPVRIFAGGVRVKSWDVMRRIWRSVTGDLGGNFDEAKRRNWWMPGWQNARSCSSIASYIAGYVAKDMLEGELNRKRYSASRNVEVPEGYAAHFAADEGTMVSLIELCCSAVDGDIGQCWFDAARGVVFMASSGRERPS